MRHFKGLVVVVVVVYVFAAGADQPINDLIKQYDDVRKVSMGYGDDYTTGSLSDYAYLKDKYRLTAVDLRKQKVLDADQKAIQQIVFQGVVGGDDNTNPRTIQRKCVRILKKNSKSSVISIIG